MSNSIEQVVLCALYMYKTPLKVDSNYNKTINEVIQTVEESFGETRYYRTRIYGPFIGGYL